MRLTTMAVAVAAGLTFLGDMPSRGDEPKAAPRSSTKARPPEAPTERVPDPHWEPRPGARVTVQSDTARGAASYGEFSDFLDATKAGDSEGIRRAVASGRVVHLAKGTAVLVIADTRPDPGPGRTMSSSGLAHAMLNARPAADPEIYPVEVRVESGDHAGKSLFVGRRDLARMIDRRVMAEFRPGDRATVAAPWGAITRESSLLSVHDLAVIDGNRAAAAAMFRDGQLTRLPGGVKVVVLGTRDDCVRVRIHSGSKMAGNWGYMMRRDLVPAPAKSATGEPRPGPEPRS